MERKAPRNKARRDLPKSQHVRKYECPSSTQLGQSQHDFTHTEDRLLCLVGISYCLIDGAEFSCGASHFLGQRNESNFSGGDALDKTVGPQRHWRRYRDPTLYRWPAP